MSETGDSGFISKFITLVIGDKRRWRQYKARVKQLPPNLMHFGSLDSDNAASLFEDVADLFERAAADGTPIRQIAGNDPVEFVDELIRNYAKSGYVARERQRLINAIDQAAGNQNGTDR
jgi:DNA-binding ferritin-like protein (Dps family)